MILLGRFYYPPQNNSFNKINAFSLRWFENMPLNRGREWARIG